MWSWDFSTTPKIDTTALLPSTRVASYPSHGVPELQKECMMLERGIRMRRWKRAHAFNWELMFKISSLILGFMALGALLIYESFIQAQ
jgi:hypothetical protein